MDRKSSFVPNTCGSGKHPSSKDASVSTTKSYHLSTSRAKSSGQQQQQGPPVESLPEVHSDEVYCMDYISDMKVADGHNLQGEGGLLLLEDTWRSEWERPLQV